MIASILTDKLEDEGLSAQFGEPFFVAPLDHGSLADGFDASVPEFIFGPLHRRAIQVKIEAVDGGVRLYSAGVEAPDREDRNTKKEVKAAMFF